MKTFKIDNLEKIVNNRIENSKDFYRKNITEWLEDVLFYKSSESTGDLLYQIVTGYVNGYKKYRAVVNVKIDPSKCNFTMEDYMNPIYQIPTNIQSIVTEMLEDIKQICDSYEVEVWSIPDSPNELEISVKCWYKKEVLN